MNLTKLFHFNYLKQNLKKSRVILSFLLLMLPILNLIIFLMTTSYDTVMVFGLLDISGLALIGLYIVPVILSIILFHYVFKKKSIDFIGSMPINRKTIFITNTIGGCLIIGALIAVTTLLIFIASMALPNVYIAKEIFLDYFVLFTLSYIFIFVITNLALSFSGNISTTIVVSLLILFLVPFTERLFTVSRETFNHQNFYYECKECQTTNLKAYKTSTSLYELNKTHYTLPVELLIQMGNNQNASSLYLDAELGRMALLTILYVLVGYLAFSKKELEVCETSFKNIYVHMLIRALTVLPIMVIIYEATKYANFIGVLFAFTLLLIYHFIYDLMTRKQVTHIRLNLAAFFLTILILYPLVGFLSGDYMTHKAKEVTFSAKDITSITIYGDGVPTLEKVGGNIKIKDEEIYNLLLSNDEESKDNIYIGYLEVNMKGRVYRSGSIYLNQENAEKLENYISSSKVYQESLKNQLTNINVITIGEDITTLEEKDYQAFKEALENPESEREEVFLPIHVYTYKNHTLIKETYYSNITKKMNQLVVNRFNEKAAEKLKEQSASSIAYIMIEDEVEGQYYYYYFPQKINEVYQLLKTQTTSSENKLYRFEFTVYDKRYYYYANLTEEAFKKMKSLAYEAETEAEGF